MLALVVFVSYTLEGVRAKGPIGYLKGLVPGGVTGGMAVFIFFLEVLSNVKANPGGVGYVTTPPTGVNVIRKF